MLKIVSPTALHVSPPLGHPSHQATPAQSSAHWPADDSPSWTMLPMSSGTARLQSDEVQSSATPSLHLHAKHVQALTPHHQLPGSSRNTYGHIVDHTKPHHHNMGEIPQQASSSNQMSKKAKTSNTANTAKRTRTVFDGVVITVPAWLLAHKRKLADASTRPRDVSPLHSGVNENDHAVHSRSVGVVSSDHEHTSTAGDTEAQSTHASEDQERRVLRERPRTSPDDYAGSSTRRAARHIHERVTDAERIDRLLEAQVAPTAIIPQYAQPYAAPAIGLWPISTSVTKTGRTDRRRAWTSYYMPRYSQISVFKERLDSRLGPGDLNRGLYRRPKAVPGQVQQESSTSDVMDANESNVDAVARSKRPRSPEIDPAATGADASDAATTEDTRPMKRPFRRHERDLQRIGGRRFGSED
ncbi:uncharacterized protein C8Q71DRAFT_729958 [Rhodofomes roseus]|uniref:Uncharacterized protein n=1 Tax=Rhodofomes roseus TaxID=34475 RepID=A0ABQ8KWS6_9APHY|nr:uncharacterized protein C8Q71DRAFT_729958 [Rhodofomes roseus]KAH9843750.1 hypothetical protein C8Q71DRAFT_729958 [Rhodofomes roseus]